MKNNLFFDWKYIRFINPLEWFLLKFKKQKIAIDYACSKSGDKTATVYYKLMFGKTYIIDIVWT